MLSTFVRGRASFSGLTRTIRPLTATPLKVGIDLERTKIMLADTAQVLPNGSSKQEKGIVQAAILGDRRYGHINLTADAWG